MEALKSITGLTEKELYRVVPFSGKKEDWRKWSRKFLAHARFRGFKEILEGKAQYPVPGDDGSYTEEQTIELERLKKLNHQGFNALVHCVDDDVSFNAVDTAVSTIYPDGCAETAWKRLVTRWEPATLTTVFEIESEFAKSRLQDVDKNPEEWITELEYFRYKIIDLGGNMTAERMIGHILSNLPKEYDITVEAIQRQILIEGRTPPIEEVLTLLRNKYKLLSNQENCYKK